MSIRSIKAYLLLSSVLLVCVFLSLRTGAVSIDASNLWGSFIHFLGFDTAYTMTELERTIVVELRIPRVFFSVFIGAGLATTGVALQGIFRNPLVDAGIVGIASGASFFAACFIVLGSFLPIIFMGNPMISLAIIAFAGALITTFLVYRISYSHGKINIVMLILSGVALNALSGSLTGLLTFFATDVQIRNLTFWTLGSLSGANTASIWILVPVISFFLYLIYRQRHALNAFALGEEAAFFLGINTQKTKKIMLLAATAIVGTSVSLVGVISFVGLVVPHVLRLWMGPDHKQLVPMSMFAGAILLTFSDWLSRVLIPPTEIPIGIVTALLGTPVLITLILKQKKQLFA